MNKKGEMEFGMILMTFITVIVGLVLLGSAIIPQVVSTTSTIFFNTSTAAAGEVTFGGATAGEITDLNGKVVTGLLAYNSNISTVAIDSGNYTINNNVINTAGELTSQLNCTGEACISPINSWNVSYTYQPVGYITSSGGRSLALLILIFTALAILVVTLVPVLRNKALDLAGI